MCLFFDLCTECCSLLFAVKGHGTVLSDLFVSFRGLCFLLGNRGAVGLDLRFICGTALDERCIFRTDSFRTGTDGVDGLFIRRYCTFCRCDVTGSFGKLDLMAGQRSLRIVQRTARFFAEGFGTGTFFLELRFACECLLVKRIQPLVFVAECFAGAGQLFIIWALTRMVSILSL